MSAILYIKEKLSDPVNFGVFLLFLIPLIFGFIYALSFYTNSNLILYIGIYVCGVLSFIPLWILIGFFLLMINPGKYKEYEMKQSRKKKAEQKRIYFFDSFTFFMDTSENGRGKLVK
jgi:predicted membrane protein